MVQMKISVIVPVYNEEDEIKKVVEKIREFSMENPRFGFVFVNDGSSDKTLDLLRKYVGETDSRIKIVSYSKNRGKGYAIRRGVEFLDSDFICFIDGDLAYSLEHLFALENKLTRYDIAIGHRGLGEKNRDNMKFVRVVFGKAFNLFSRTILGLKFRDMQAGLKGFRKKAVKRIFGLQKIDGFAFDVEVVYLAKKNGFSVGEIPARVSREHLKKKSQVKLIKDSIRMFISLMIIKFNDLTGKYG